MYVDSQLEFSDAQAVTATAISTNVIDLQPEDQTNVLQDIGHGEDMYLVVKTKTACTSATSAATLTLTLESDSTADLATSATVHHSSGAIVFASFAPAKSEVAVIKLPAGDYERYLGLRFTVGTENLTAGAFDAFITKDIQKAKEYASGFSV